MAVAPHLANILPLMWPSRVSDIAITKQDWTDGSNICGERKVVHTVT